MMQKVRTGTDAVVRFAKDSAGATAIEYALIAGGISIAIVVSVSDVGSEVVSLFSSMQGIF